MFTFYKNLATPPYDNAVLIVGSASFI